MKVIGMTGGIASGKTTVLAMLKELGAYVIDTDLVVHDLMKSTSHLFKFIVQHFGKSVLNQAGEVDRGKLGQIAFSDPCALAYLEGCSSLVSFVRLSSPHTCASNNNRQ